MPAVSFRGVPCAAKPDGLLTPCPDFCATVSGRLGGSFGVSDGGEVTGKPGNCGNDDVVTDAVLVAIVAAEVGTAMGARATPSEPLRELGGLAVEIELSSDARGERREKERRLSLSGLASGGGMLMFALSIVVIEWADCRRPAFRLGKSSSPVAASKEWETDRPLIFNGLGTSLFKLADEERDMMAVRLLL